MADTALGNEDINLLLPLSGAEGSETEVAMKQPAAVRTFRQRRVRVKGKFIERRWMHLHSLASAVVSGIKSWHADKAVERT